MKARLNELILLKDGTYGVVVEIRPGMDRRYVVQRTDHQGKRPYWNALKVRSFEIEESLGGSYPGAGRYHRRNK